MLFDELLAIACFFFILLVDARHLQGRGSRRQAGIVVIFDSTSLHADGRTKGRDYEHVAAACGAH